MLDLKRLENLTLRKRPLGQIVVGHLMLAPNFTIPPRVHITLEGFEKVPPAPVIFAMNHTDRYNYWPFQYKVWRAHDRFTATWVKGKYYENRFVGAFMQSTNNIPAVSRGYLITKDFLATVKRRPSDDEYRQLRKWVTARANGDACEMPRDMPLELMEKGRNIFGRPFHPKQEDYADYVNGLFREMTARFVALNEESREKQIDLLVFPQGTRSKRLTRGRIGLAQIALHLKTPIVPVGCSGSDTLYPGSSPLAKGGRVTYRLGDPITYEALREFHLPPFVPFTAEAERTHGEAFQGLVDLVMQRINGLVDEPYQFGDEEQRIVSASRRFV